MAAFRIYQDLGRVPEGSNCAILIRQAERKGEEEGEAGTNVDTPLTESGKARSLQLGSAMARYPELRCYTSPVESCVETGRLIAQGHGGLAEVEATEFLGTKAPFMLDPDKACKLMRDTGLVRFVRLYVSDSIDPNVVLPCRDGTRMLFSFAIERIRQMRGGIGVFVTHDHVLTPPLACLLDYDVEGKGPVPALDGIVLYRTSTGYAARYGGKTVRVAMNGVVLR